uniref:Uncharacterized protein n=1 Tax=Oscillatoriales cyanobacterium SpSt-418 TaxID=2282169 RepID=A0A7C3KGG3_9CYAN
MNTAKSLGRRVVANLSFDLTEKGADGSVTTRSAWTFSFLGRAVLSFVVILNKTLKPNPFL